MQHQIRILVPGNGDLEARVNRAHSKHLTALTLVGAVARLEAERSSAFLLPEAAGLVVSSRRHPGAAPERRIFDVFKKASKNRVAWNLAARAAGREDLAGRDDVRRACRLVLYLGMRLGQLKAERDTLLRKSVGDAGALRVAGMDAIAAFQRREWSAPAARAFLELYGEAPAPDAPPPPVEPTTVGQALAKAGVTVQAREPVRVHVLQDPRPQAVGPFEEVTELVAPKALLVRLVRVGVSTIEVEATSEPIEGDDEAFVAAAEMAERYGCSGAVMLTPGGRVWAVERRGEDVEVFAC